MLGGKRRVLVVDDDASVRLALCRMLSGESNLVSVGVATSGEEACASAAAERPDIVVMDMQMPGMDGLDATRWIARYVPCALVVGMSAADASVAAFSMRAAGAVTFVSKTDGMRRVLDAVHAAAAVAWGDES